MKISKKLIVACAALAFALFCLTGCDFYEADEDTSNQRKWGDTVTISYEFNFWTHRGPFIMEVTPMGPITLNVKGEEVDCIEVKVKPISTEDKDDPAYGDVVTPIDLLKADFDEVPIRVWYVDKEGNEFENIRTGTLEIGVERTFYIPLRERFENSGITWVAVSDRDGYYQRVGATYWYPFNQ